MRKGIFFYPMKALKGAFFFSVLLYFILCGGPLLGRQYLRHEGDIIIEGNEEYRIENKEFRLKGNILVKDSGRLIINNSTIYLEQDFDNQYYILVRKNGYLEAYNSSFDSKWRFHIQWGYSGWFGEEPLENEKPRGLFKKVTIKLYVYTCVQEGGRLYVLNSNLAHIRGGYPGSRVYVQNSSIEDFRFLNKSIIRINNSTIGSLWPYLTGKTRISLSGLKPQYYENWALGRPENSDFDVIISKTQINYWIPYVGDEAIATISDSKLALIEMIFPPGLASIKGLKNSIYYKYWNLRANSGINFSYNIILKKSVVDNWWIQAGKDCRLSIDDCQIARIALSENTKVKILNSVIGEAEFKDLSSGEIRNSKILHCLVFGPNYARKFLGPLLVHNTEISGSLFLEFTDMILLGNIAFQNAKVARWYRSKAKRKYNILAIKDNTKCAGADISVYDPSGQKIWFGKTDHEGKASISLDFINSTHKKAFTLKSATLKCQIPVYFLTSTPIILKGS